MANKGNGKDNSANIGHNSTLTDDERRALTLHHKRLYEAADAIVEKAKAERSAVADQAKSDLGKGALAEIKDLIAYSDTKKLKGNVERMLRLARWLGLPVGTQAVLFEAAAEERAQEDGKTAGMSGLMCEPPRHLAAHAHQLWIEGWHEGQAVLASAFKKKREKDDPAEQAQSPDPAQAESREEAVAG